MSKKPTTHEFQAETKQVLDIVVNSLYKDKEIFVRELISNASDALEKLRRLQLTEKEVFDDGLDLEINVTTDDSANQLIIQDFGIGMTEEELVENLGTIAHSGSKEFMEALKADGDKNDALIGKFGVGFYSVFMVADNVQAYTRSWHADGTGQCWESKGDGSYSIQSAEGQRRGTKIVIGLKEDFAEFAKEDRIKEIIKKYSAFVQFPVSVNGEKVNTVDAIWMRSKNEIKDEEYEEFYKFQSNDYEAPLIACTSARMLLWKSTPPLRAQAQYGKDGDVQKRKQGRPSLPEGSDRCRAQGFVPGMAPFSQGRGRQFGFAPERFPGNHAGQRPHA